MVRTVKQAGLDSLEQLRVNAAVSVVQPVTGISTMHTTAEPLEHKQWAETTDSALQTSILSRSSPSGSYGR
jgi:hypothetical protein